MGNFHMLPSEIMLQILSRVPAGSVSDCKIVSKPWRDVIQQACFLQMHLNHLNGNFDSGESIFILNTPRDQQKQGTTLYGTTPYGGYALCGTTPFSYTEYDECLNRFRRIKRINLRPPFKGYLILGSCNGLICFNAFNDIHSGYTPAYICNPITREYVILPKLQAGRGALLTGFGYNTSTNEYKVVSISNSMTNTDVQVYSLGSGIGWRKVTTMGCKMVCVRQLYGAFVNGSIYWVDKKGTIVAFDLVDEKLRRIPSPPFLPLTDPHFFVRLVGLGDLLCAYCTHSGGVHIWYLKGNINNQDVIWDKEFASHITVRPITFTKSGELLCLDYKDRNVYLYAPKVSSSRMLENFGESDIFQFQVLHKSTLVSLKALGEEDTKLMDSGERTSSRGETESSDH